MKDSFKNKVAVITGGAISPNTHITHLTQHFSDTIRIY